MMSRLEALKAVVATLENSHATIESVEHGRLNSEEIAWLNEYNSALVTARRQFSMSLRRQEGK